MSSTEDIRHRLLRGPLAERGPWPLILCARLCDLRPRFLPKGEAGRGYRAVSRNGRVLLASDRPVAELAGSVARCRFQTWHKRVLFDGPPAPYGLLLYARLDAVRPDYDVALVPDPDEPFELALDVGGGRWLAFRRSFANGG